jgi:hypothetical protein
MFGTVSYSPAHCVSLAVNARCPVFLARDRFGAACPTGWCCCRWRNGGGADEIATAATAAGELNHIITQFRLLPLMEFSGACNIPLRVQAFGWLVPQRRTRFRTGKWTKIRPLECLPLAARSCGCWGIWWFRCGLGQRISCRSQSPRAYCAVDSAGSRPVRSMRRAGKHYLSLPTPAQAGKGRHVAFRALFASRQPSPASSRLCR